VRFEVSSRVLAPDLDVLAPVRTWGLTRADCIDLADKWEIPISATKEKLYSIDENMWGRAIECGVLENPWARLPKNRSRSRGVPADAPAEPAELVVAFEPACRSRSTARAWTLSRSSNPLARKSGATAGVASTWSRTAASASRAARCTSARHHSR
jgi:argininosuccinate synthase